MILYKLANKILSFKKRIGFIANNDEPIPGPQPSPEPIYPDPPAPEPDPSIIPPNTIRFKFYGVNPPIDKITDGTWKQIIVDENIWDYTIPDIIINRKFANILTENYPCDILGIGEIPKNGNFSELFALCEGIKSINNINVNDSTDISWMFMNCNNIKSGMKEFYDQIKNWPSNITEQVFIAAGQDTTEGIVETSQIPQAFGGIMEPYAERLSNNRSEITIANKKYETVIINDQEWMAENLNYEFGQNTIYHDRFGGYYELSELFNEDGGTNISNVIPAGWRIPTQEDWDRLITFCQNDTRGNNITYPNYTSFNAKLASSKLKSFKRTFNNYDDKKHWIGGFGSDVYGFSIEPAGKIDYGKLDYIGKEAKFWTNTEYNPSLPPGYFGRYYVSVNNNMDEVQTGNEISIMGKAYANVRLVSDGSIKKVKIGEHYYKTKQIGNLIWTIENIYEPVSYTYYSSRNPAYRWINNDPTNPDGYGMAYAPGISQLQTEFANLAPEGWRVPTINDWESSFNGYSSIDLIDSTETVGSEHGYNTLGFCAKCAGGFQDHYTDGSDILFGYKVESCYIAAGTDNINCFFIYSPNGDRATRPQPYYMTSDRHAYPLRLCRNA